MLLNWLVLSLWLLGGLGDVGFNGCWLAVGFAIAVGLLGYGCLGLLMFVAIVGLCCCV